jgi:hypothetical protein
MSRPDRVRALGEKVFRWTLFPILVGLLIVSASGPFHERPLLHLAALGLAGAGWLLAVALARSTDEAEAATPARVWILVGALALHLLAWGGVTALSDDVHRYLWEGNLILEGESPWAAAPDAPERAAQRERWPELFGRVNHPGVSAAYPQVAQAAHSAVAAVVRASGGDLVRHGPRAMAAFYALWSLAVLFPLGRLLRRRGLPPRLLVVWAWCPFVPLEFAGSAHLDSLGIFLLLAALDLVETGRASVQGSRRDAEGLAPREIAGILVLAAGVLVKFLPLCAMPALVRGRRGSQRLALLVLGMMTLCLPFLLLRGGIKGWGTGLGQYAQRWESPNMFYRLVEGALTPLDALLPGTPSELVGRTLVALTLLALAISTWRMRLEPLETCAMLLAAFLLLTPTLHPWYLTWIVPFLPFLPAGRARPWLLLIVCAPLFYWPLIAYRSGLGWIEPSWLWPCVVLPFGLLWWTGRRGESLAPLLP